jgi:zinc protease
MILKRDIMPPIYDIENINIQYPKHFELDNGIPVYIIKSTTIKSVRLDILFSAGQFYQNEPLLSTYTNLMLREGSKLFKGKEIANKLDYYGVFSENIVQRRKAGMGFFILNKYFDKVIPIVADIILNPTFPENEFELQKKNTHQKLLVGKEKVAHLASKKYKSAIYGNTHPFGYELNPEDSLKTELCNLQKFADERYTSKNCSIILSGNVNSKVISSVNKYFGKTHWHKSYFETKENLLFSTSTERVHIIEKKDAVQSAIKIGNIIQAKSFEDIFGLKFINTVLGGFFGSRLMMNLREDKGYTYGIGSRLSLLNSNYAEFTISTETGTDVCKSALHEIYTELEKIIAKPISLDELDLVRKYIMGNMLAMFDGPFLSANALRSLLESDLQYDYLESNIEYLKSIDLNILYQTAIKYFEPNNLFQVVAGKCSG